MSTSSPELEAHEDNRDEHLSSLVRRWKAGEAGVGMMTDEEVEELDKAVELGLVSQEELMENPDAA